MKESFMHFYNLIFNLCGNYKEIDKSKMPSQNLFYKDDFTIKIKKAEKSDIKEYEEDFVKEDLASIIDKVKTIVEKNLILPKSYVFEDLKSIDVVFLFLEIVKFTTGRKIKINYIDEEENRLETIEFDEKNFNYFKLDKNTREFYNPVKKSFNMSGYTYTLPSIGVENSLTLFLIMKSDTIDIQKYSKLGFEFTYFLSDKNFLTFQEIENLIEIFNFDMEEEEKIKVKNIIKTFEPLQKYSLIKNGKVIDINSKIDLEKIWK
jgi:hypothetical protein